MTTESPPPPTPPESRRVRHGTTTVTRDIAAPRARVFAVFADFSLRQKWFRIPSRPEHLHHTLDFRVGGTEVAGGIFAPTGTAEHIEYRSRFLDIVDDERIVFGYELRINDVRRTMAQVTVEIEALDADHTRLRYTEQFVLVGFDGDGDQDFAHQRGMLPLMLNGLEGVATGRITS
ncbi:SRPBCC domain-containing protein [Nocardia otitidiscaviarum]|uniref:SRPBCC domain-containing protein n=1 Tax=Nocardia otitidiscaviarum TaxID=1823 RepID=UPI002457754D|nr:SRPBCC domain-containing protein [Nocardia otitidiscaviarum]